MGKSIDPDKLGADFAFQLLPEDWDHFEPMLQHAMHRLPVLAEAEVRMLLNGPESFTPDGSFLLGESAETRGFYLGCGMNSVGVATGGGAGWALAHDIIHGTPPMDLHEADPKRFDPSWSDVAALSARVPEVLGKHYEITYPGRQWVRARDQRHLPLHDEWLAEKAFFGQVYGYERPLYFSSDMPPKMTFDQPDWFEQVGREVKHITDAAGVTDLSSFGKIDITGRDALTALEWVASNRMDRPVGSIIYTLMLNDKGGIVSDLTVFRLSKCHFRLYVGSSALKHDLTWIRNQMHDDWDITIQDVTETYATLGFMGVETKRV
ncbi:MAG: FAD-dependent oxidoreductase, partial [Candidatus Puniceispirillales bacterium]